MKKYTILLFLCCLFAFNAASVMAQSMTDNQVIQYVKKEHNRGTSQDEIVQALVRKGVTKDQLQRIKKKLEAEQKQLGAMNDTGASEQTGNRTRSKQQQGNYMVNSKEEEDKWNSMSHTSRASELSEGFDGLGLDSMIYRFNDKRVFGRDIFNKNNLSFEPNMNMATPPNYVLGAGDVVNVDIWGASQQTLTSTISPDGTIVLDYVGPVKIAGMTVQSANNHLKNAIASSYADCNVSLTLGSSRSIIVNVLGEVVLPGTYTISSLSSAFNALYAAGGISEIGTLRDIEVYRQGRVIAHIDVYDYLMNGNDVGNVALQDNDIIRVGTYDCIVEVRGQVKRPMLYEMKSSESLQQLLQYAGGYTGKAYTKNARVIRKAGNEYSIHTVEEFSMNGFSMQDGDSVYVDSIYARFKNMVEVRGAVKHPGQYQYGGAVQTVRQLLEIADGLREDALTERAVMHREKEDLTLEMISIDMQGILDGTAPDIPLQKNDVLFIPSKIEMQGERTLRINGEVNYPGTYQYAENTTIRDFILQAGGFTRAASIAKIDVFRRNYDPAALTTNSDIAKVFTFSYENGTLEEDSVFYLQPYDEVQVRKSPAYEVQQNVSVSGCINFSGEYAMTSKEFRLSDLVKIAGGLTDVAYTKGAQLVRQMTSEERDQREKTLRNSQIALYEQQLKKENQNYNKELADTLLDLKMDLGYEYPVAINLDKAIETPGGIDDIVLRANDRLIIPQATNTIKISGEVMYPISVNYVKGKSLSYYINSAGGYAKNASKSKTYTIHMNGAVDKLGRCCRSSKITPGCEIVVPSKETKGKMSAAEIAVLSTSIASLSTLVVAIINVTK